VIDLQTKSNKHNTVYIFSFEYIMKLKVLHVYIFSEEEQIFVSLRYVKK